MKITKEVSVLETVSVGRVFLIRAFDNTGLLLVGRQTQFSGRTGTDSIFQKVY